jgi:hypothetical protein
MRGDADTAIQFMLDGIRANSQLSSLRGLLVHAARSRIHWSTARTGISMSTLTEPVGRVGAVPIALHVIAKQMERAQTPMGGQLDPQSVQSTMKWTMLDPAVSQWLREDDDGLVQLQSMDIPDTFLSDLVDGQNPSTGRPIGFQDLLDDWQETVSRTQTIYPSGGEDYRYDLCVRDAIEGILNSVDSDEIEGARQQLEPLDSSFKQHTTPFEGTLLFQLELPWLARQPINSLDLFTIPGPAGS